MGACASVQKAMLKADAPAPEPTKEEISEVNNATAQEVKVEKEEEKMVVEEKETKVEETKAEEVKAVDVDDNLQSLGSLLNKDEENKKETQSAGAEEVPSKPENKEEGANKTVKIAEVEVTSKVAPVVEAEKTEDKATTQVKEQ